MVDYTVDGTKLTFNETNTTFDIIGGRPKRVLVSLSKEDAKLLGCNGAMGVAHRYGLGTSIGKAYKLISYLLERKNSR